MDTKEILAFTPLVVSAIALLLGVIYFWASYRLKVLGVNLTALDNFLKNRGIENLLRLFKDKTPDEITNTLQKIVTAAEELRELAIGEERRRIAIAASIHDEPTARIHDRIQDNHKLFLRLRENRPSKIFLGAHFSDLPAVHEVIQTHQSIFIESGSTLSHALLSITDNFRKLRPDYEKNPLTICTNNIRRVPDGVAA